MIVRIVKMQFKITEVENFKKLFEERKEKIRSFPGCQYLELLQGSEGKKTTFMTYSYWDSETALNNYRYSDLFSDTWSITKKMFASKPEAISCTKLHELS